MSTTYTVELESDPNDPESLLLTLPDEVLARAGWAPGDVLIWDLQENGTISLTKKPHDIQQG